MLAASLATSSAVGTSTGTLSAKTMAEASVDSILPSSSACEEMVKQALKILGH